MRIRSNSLPRDATSKLSAWCRTAATVSERGRSWFMFSNRDLGFNRVVIGPYATVRGVEKPSGSQGLDISMDVAVVAPQCLRQSADTGDVVPVDVAQQLHPPSRQDADEGVPAFERQMALMENLSTLRPMPSIDKSS